MKRLLSSIAPLVCAMSLASLTARAQSSDAVKMARGQALYDEADKDMTARRYDAACPKLEEVIRLVPEGIGARITLAECYEEQGKLASAWARYREAQAKAQAVGQKDREKKARQRAEALEGKLAKLTIAVPEAVAKLPGLVIQRDGEALDPALLNAALPIDRGEHRISARAKGKQEWTGSVVIEKDGESRYISIPKLKAEADEEEEEDEPETSKGRRSPPPPRRAAPPPPPTGGPPPPSSGPSPDDPLGIASTSSNSTVILDPATRRITGIVLGAAGIGAFVGGIFLFKDGEEEKEECLPLAGICTGEPLGATAESAETKSNIGLGLMIGGGVVAVVGVVVLLTADSYSTPAAGAPKKAKRGGVFESVGLVVGPGRLGLTGTF